ncbi:MAG: phosphomannomutase [Deltaproteobacteria bacterium]|nr:phosphomannomutase [Deltaproteobacteria bacterium]
MGVEVPRFMAKAPVPLAFGTSGLRGLVTDMTDLEVGINVAGFLRFLRRAGMIEAGCPVAVARDLRHVDPKSGLVSSPRIAAAAASAIEREGYRVINAGTIPTPALAYFATGRRTPTDDRWPGPMPAVMVTGSHIPADRNGVKFYRPDGEVLKGDEPGILAAVAEVRRALYSATASSSAYDSEGALTSPSPLPPVVPEAARMYVERYTRLWHRSDRPLSGLKVVVYEHSAVGRDLLVEVLESAGVDVVREERSETFVAVDTEDVSPDEEAHYARLVARHGAHALVSTDGDGDRPLVVDETGRFHRGDVLGAVVAEWLGADYAAIPVSTNDAVELHFARTGGLKLASTQIGSPYVIQAMNEARTQGFTKVVAWEANGGFLTGADFNVGDGFLTALPTRDAMLPILGALFSAQAADDRRMSSVFGRFPDRRTRAGLIDDFPRARALAILARLRPAGGEERIAPEVERCFSAIPSLGTVDRMNSVDGVRIYFSGGDVIHFRASGNAPQFRVYVVSATQERADEIVKLCVRHPDGVVYRLGDLSLACD